MFEDRKDAGRQLAHALERFRGEHPLVLAIPRGGVEVGYEVARALNAEFSLVIVRKLPFPDNPESGFGAIAEDGSVFLHEIAAGLVSESEKKMIIDEQRREIQRRISVLRGGKPLPVIARRTVILVDDGIAMGSTMIAAIQLCKNKHAGKIIVAAPVAGSSTIEKLKGIVDEVVVVEIPRSFHAVAQVYTHWYDVSDDEVIMLVRNIAASKPS